MFGYYDDKERYFLLSSLAERNETPEAFLQKLDALQSVMETGSRDPSAWVTLSTIHSSKGLEYDRVILIDALEGILPSSGSGSGSGPGSGSAGRAKSFLPADLEEERRGSGFRVSRTDRGFRGSRREKVPACLCRKVSGTDRKIDVNR